MTDYTIVPKFGYGKMRTWFEPRYNDEAGRVELIGMGQTIFYDRDGKIEQIEESETGLVMIYGGVDMADRKSKTPLIIGAALCAWAVLAAVIYIVYSIVETVK